MIALHAAALEPRVEEVTIEGSIVSWEDVVRTPDSVGQISNVVPGVLTRYDLPDLIASLLRARSPSSTRSTPAGNRSAKRRWRACSAGLARHMPTSEHLINWC